MRQIRVMAKALLALLLFLGLPAGAFELPTASKQVVVGLADSWDASHVSVTLYERSGKSWQRVAGPWKGRLGKRGLAWGRGLHPLPTGSGAKREGDWKAPAGVFRIGGAWGYAPAKKLQMHPKLFYRQVTTRDLWYEDPASKYYNQYRHLDHEPKTASEKKAQMKQGDYPHSLKLFIAHNAPPKATPGAGSAIFFHIWRGGGAKPTSGCTTLPEPKLKTLLARLNPDLQPLYVLLPKAEYDKRRKEWKLP